MVIVYLYKFHSIRIDVNYQEQLMDQNTIQVVCLRWTMILVLQIGRFIRKPVWMSYHNFGMSL